MNKGKLFFYYGTMNSGKSSLLFLTAFNFEERKIPFLIFKSEIDDRDGIDVIHSRALGDRECVSVNKTLNLFDCVKKIMSVNDALYKPQLKWILVDEAQFLTEAQVDQLSYIVDVFGLNVLCYGLRTDFKTKLFDGSKRLFEIADTIQEVKSTCGCGNKTIMNARVDSNGNVIVDGEQIEVGGNERYTSMCRKCYNEKIGNPYYKNK